MSVKIKISYEREDEAAAILTLLRPLNGLFSMKKSEGKPPYKHIYFTSRNGGKARHGKGSA